MLSIQEQVVLSFRTIIEMLRDRGIVTEALESISPTELDALSTNHNFFTIKVNDELSIVYYMSKMKISEFKTALLGKNKDDVPEGTRIFVFKDELNTQNRNNIANIFAKHQVFHIKELLFNVSMHNLVPKHEVIKNPDEVDSIMKRYNIKIKAHFPLIQSTDAMAKYLGLVPGDLVRIVRTSPTVGAYSYYRICVA